MDPFGSREDDPLLQGDPFAPTSSEDDADGGEAASENRSPVETGEASRSGETTGESVFEESGSHFALDGDGDTRVVFRSAEGASEGRLTVLNAAFDQGWSLDRVELRKGEGGGAGTSIAFVLRQVEDG